MSTPNFGLPFPGLGDLPNVPDDLQRLATAVDGALADQSVPPSGYAQTVPDLFAVGTGWTPVASLQWTAAGGASPNGSALDLPTAGVYLCVLRINLQDKGADGSVQARVGQATASYDLGGTAIAGGTPAHWHSITGVYPVNAPVSLKLWLASNTARNANYLGFTVVRLSREVWA